MLYLVGSKPSSSGLGGKAGEQEDILGGVIARHGAYYHHSKAGEDALVRLTRGVYCDNEDLADLKGFLRKNALRIASYLYKDVALTHASAYLKGVVESHDPADQKTPLKLYLAGNHRHQSQIGCLEIVQMEALNKGKIGQFLLPVRDNQDKLYGPLNMSCLSDEVVFLQQFSRKRYNLQRFLPPPTLNRLYADLALKHTDSLLSRLRIVCEEIGGMGSEMDGALNYCHEAAQRARLGLPVAASFYTGTQLNLPLNAQEIEMNNVFEYEMGWYGRPIAKIVNNGVAWNFSFNEGWMLPLTNGKLRPGIMPPFIQNLFPEGYLHDVLNDGETSGLTVSILEKSERYLSNISIVKDKERLKFIPLDMLSGRLAAFNDRFQVFKGVMSEMPNTSEDFIGDLNSMLASIEMPRFSGHQPKIPCHLDESGNLSPAAGKSFTHILKLAGLSNDPNHLRGAVEWASMSMAKAGGVVVCDFSLLEMESGALAYVCERFDIPDNEDDMRMIYAEDFCSVFNKNSVFKYGVDGLEQFISQYSQTVINKPADDVQLFKQIYANYLLENADYHLKNASVIRVASPTLDSFRTTRLAPAYDIMNTRYFSEFPMPQDGLQKMSMGIAGKAHELGLEEFKQIGSLLQMDGEKVQALMRETANGIAQKAREISSALPQMIDDRPKARSVVLDMCDRAVFMCNSHFPDIEPLCAKEELGRHLTSPVSRYSQDDEPQEIRSIRNALKL